VAAAEPRTRKTIAPASSRPVWCSEPATKLGASEVNMPNTAKAANAPAAATAHPIRFSLDTRIRCGR
jgi:hypothetical protein